MLRELAGVLLWTPRREVWLHVTTIVEKASSFLGSTGNILYRVPAAGVVPSHLQHTHCDSRGEAGRRQDFLLNGVLRKIS